MNNTKKNDFFAENKKLEQMFEFSFYTADKSSYSIQKKTDYEYGTELIIPSEYNGKSITNISDCAFEFLETIKSVIIPKSVTSIGEDAFYSCTSLHSIIIENGTKIIKARAFAYCSSLSSITIPNTVTSIGQGAFKGCDSLNSIIIENGVNSFEDDMLYKCSSLSSITIPNTVTSIGNYAFYACKSLSSITIPKSVTSIDEYAGCEALDKIKVADSNPIYDSRENCNAIIEKSTNKLILGCNNTIIPSSVTSIESYAFYACKSLSSITIPNRTTSIGELAFYGCEVLDKIKVADDNSNYDSRENCNAIIEKSTNKLILGCKNTIIPRSVTSIESYAFYACKSLSLITIPKSVTKIGNYAFSVCPALEQIKVADGNPNYDSRENCNAIIEKSTNKLVLGCKNTIISNSVKTIGRAAFYGCSSLHSLTIPNSVKIIEDFAFSECLSLSSIIIPSSVKSIKFEAFSKCTSLNSIIIQNGVKSIEDHAFLECLSLSSIIIPSSVESIGVYAFIHCPSLTKIFYERDTKPNKVKLELWDTTAKLYLYSNTPNKDGNHWRYVDGKPVVWE